MNSLPAILGGKSIFEKPVHIVKPWLPAYSSVASQIQSIFDSKMVTKGQYLAAFEEKIANHLKVKHAVGVSSCTTGLMLTYRCLELSGEVIVPSFTFMATVSALVWAGLTPVYVDVKKETTNIDTKLIEAAITPKTSAIVAVHNFGTPSEIGELQRIAKKHNLKLVFDAAHGMGSIYQGKPIGGFGDAEVFSLSPTKLLIAGEGGIVATNNDELARRIRLGREYGNSGNYDSEFAGFNARMAEFNALLGLNSLDLLEESVQNRNKYVKSFKQLLSDVQGISFQQVNPEDRSSYKDFSLLIDQEQFGVSRNVLSKSLQAEKIDTRHYYDPAVHKQTAYKKYFVESMSLPNTIFLEQNSISLPLYSLMDDETIEGVCNAIVRVRNNAKKIQETL